jgi:LPXTG-site transpeptidase (sortase) family protein
VVITFRVSVLNGINNVNNQASSITDTTGNGTFNPANPASISPSNIASWSRNGGGGGGGVNPPGILPLGVNPLAVIPLTGFAPGVTTSLAPEPANMYNVSSDLTIEIPSLGIKTAIVGVPQSGNTWDITWLGDQVGYLAGTAYPTWSGNSVLTGHVYEANGLPGPFVNLSTLKWGDQIIIHFAGQQYIYKVQENKIVSPTDRSAFKHEDQPWLTLVTCKDYNASANTYKYRVVVGAVLIKTESDTSSNPSRK